jgi:hypothetical protein
MRYLSLTVSPAGPKVNLNPSSPVQPRRRTMLLNLFPGEADGID